MTGPLQRQFSCHGVALLRLTAATCLDTFHITRPERVSTSGVGG